MSVRVRGKILYIDFSCLVPINKGGKIVLQKKRCVESTRWKDNEANRAKAKAKDKAIGFHLKNSSFKYLDFFRDGSKAKYFNNAVESKVTFGQFWEDWLAPKILASNTAKGWASSYNCHIKEVFAHRSISEISQDDLLLFRKMLFEVKKLKASSINDKVMKPIRMCFHKAYKNSLILVNPCDELKKLKETKPEIDPFSFEELKSWLDYLEGNIPEWYDLILIWSRTGLRPGEFFALKWTCVDYHNAKLKIRETHHREGDGPTKTASSNRDVDMTAVVMDAFKRQEKRTRLKSEYVFVTQAGNPYTTEFMVKKFAYVLKLAGLRYRPPVQLRHTFATLHIGSGENISWVSAMLGHTTVEMTLKRYNRFIRNLTHTDGSAFERVMANLARQKAQETSNG